ncbi:DUF3450 domain-containing protein [Desulfatibacillum aliphaticivorans]|uniref:DUF3450 domain-containing protein n=1 Tax=Desulfatibacillum aliphaticivorans TaxID=218208 RepID=UPI000686E222|nr:DUF3450 domain-containing protein [Desulfatibacillum aliphaticivorans]
MNPKYFLCFLLMLAASPALAGNVLDTVEKPLGDSIHIRQDAQKKMDKWGVERQELEARYRELQSLVEQQTKTLNASKEREQSLEQAAAQKQTRLENARRMGEELTPFLHDSLSRLELLIYEGDAFLIPERQARLDRLRTTISAPDISPGEMYRKVMEAFLVEAEYGNTVEVYRETLNVEGADIRANVLRFGRLAMFCQTLDEKQCGVLDSATGQWRRLPAKFVPELSRAFSMAQKQLPMDIVSLPLGKVNP